MKYELGATKNRNRWLSGNLPLILPFGFLMLVGLIGFFFLADYSYRPAVASESLAMTMPVKHLANAEAKRTVVFFYHPHCPCTRATIRNLQRLLSDCSLSPKILAYAFYPGNKSEQWIESDQTELLRTIPGLEIYPDPDGENCSQFGVSASGHLLIYDQIGKLRFSGGITPARGHEGDSLGGQRFVECVNRETDILIREPVFGCSIVEAKGGQ